MEYGAGERRVRVLDGIDLAIARGDFVSLIGSSGCGKSLIRGRPPLPPMAS